MALSALIQVTNISSFVSPQQVKELLSYLGDIMELRVFPESEMRALEAPSKVAFVRFRDADSCNVALHLHETVMGDRQLRITKSDLATIPEEEQAMSFAAPAADAIPLSIAVELARNQSVSALLPTPGLLGTAPVAVTVAPAPIVPLPIPTPTPTATLPILPDPASTVGVLSAMGTVIPPPPPLTGNVDPSKIDEIRRTIYVGNLNTSLSAEEVMKFFEPCGKINFVRMAGDETQPTRFAFVEFNEHRSMNMALRLNGGMLGGRPIKVNHSKNAIVKPQAKAPEAEKREAEQAMRKVKEASQLIQTVLDPAVASRTTSTRRSRSRSRSKGRRSSSPSWSRSRGRRGRRSRSRSYSPRRSSYGHAPSSASRHRSKYSSRRYHRSRSRSKESRRRRSKERSRSRSKSRSRSRSPKKHKSKKRRHRSRSKSASPVAASKRSPSKSPSRSPTAAGTNSN